MHLVSFLYLYNCGGPKKEMGFGCVSENKRIEACSSSLLYVEVPYECLVDRLVFTCPKVVNGSILGIIVDNPLSGRCVPMLFSCKDTNPFSGLVRVDKTLS